MKRRTFLQLLGITAVPTLPLTGTALGQALTSESLVTTLIRIETEQKDSGIIKPFYFQIPCKYAVNERGTAACHPIKRILTMQAGQEATYLNSIWTKVPEKLQEFYTWAGVKEPVWLQIPVPRTLIDEGRNQTLTISWSKDGLWSLGM